MVETHFKFFKHQPSLLYKDEPTIIFDCPARISPAKNKIPVFLFVKNYQNIKYDFSPEIVNTKIVSKSKIIAEYYFENIDEHKIYDKYDLTTYRFFVEKPNLNNENIFIYPKLSYKKQTNANHIAVDNINTSSKMPFSVFIASEEYPNDTENPAKFYDLHCHSSHTNDHIEFGAPIISIRDAAEYSGLNGVAITDHSYDLSCNPKNFLEKDEELTHWNDLQEECCNSVSHTPVPTTGVFLGEEISVMRNNGGAVHLGAINNKNFVTGTADGARKGYKRKNEPTIYEVVKSVLDDGGILFAAHPGEIPNIIHRLFLRRDYWRFSDFEKLPVTAFQAINGNFNKSWQVARKLWIALLLSGNKIPLIAGNDSHGDFNRYRAMSIPFVCIEENFDRYFGKARTGIYQNDVITAIKNGQTFITTGAYLSVIGAKLTVKSSFEFGRIKRASIFLGNYKKRKEECFIINFTENKYSFYKEISHKLLESCDYYRAECECVNNNGYLSIAATSAVFINT